MTAPGAGAPGGATGAPAAATGPAAKASGGGCLKGCLLGCGGLTVLLVILLVAGWFGWRRYGRPWLAHKEQAVARYVPSGLLPGHGASAAGAPGASHLAAALAPRLPAAPGRTARTALPHDLWVPAAGDAPAAYDTQAGGLATAMVRVEGATVGGLLARARRGMHARGWKLVYAGDDGKGQILRFQRPGAAASVGLYPRTGAVEVWVWRRARSRGGSRSGSGAGSGP